MKQVMQKPRSRNCGLTLVELLVGMSCTTLVGLALVSMMFAVTRGTSSDQDMRVLVVKHKIMDGRLTAAVRGSRQVLVQNEHYLVLWTYDRDNSNTPNLVELRRIEYDNDTATLRSYKTPDDLPDADNTEYDPDDDFDAITTALKGSANFIEEIWCDDVSAWSNSINADEVASATLVNFRWTLVARTMPDEGTASAALRNAQ